MPASCVTTLLSLWDDSFLLFGLLEQGRIDLVKSSSSSKPISASSDRFLEAISLFPKREVRTTEFSRCNKKESEVMRLSSVRGDLWA